MPYERLRFSSGFFLQHSKGVGFHYATLFKSESDGQSDPIHAKWGWYGLMHQLAKGDITKMREVESIYLEEALTFMAYEKDLSLEDKVKM